MMKESFWETHALALCDTFVVPLRNQISETKILPEMKATNGVLDKEHVLKLQGTGNPRNKSKKSNFAPSPFPELDDFVNRKLATRKGLNGSIRSWSLDDNQITYFMKVGGFEKYVQKFKN